MEMGENHEICNPLKHLKEAFADFAISPNLHLPHLPSASLNKNLNPCDKSMKSCFMCGKCVTLHKTGIKNVWNITFSTLRQ